ncbi:NAD(P)/FAD-dependent oxidoreductase [Aciduricibacillus chroicocephali]|uniref:NAD(P)/FAD-dependent oxidoreductase n=1 Tax=Aciduricibacillus chroicocephali TaxID=3054939 RepID=A0ABY9KSY5_9BACI|nr:NAD(P)/FAD-dependent oxidoreductase [Bacillaceae bacterium 44XB]
MIYDTIVIGGGPSGLMSAISAAEHGAKTLLLEKGSKLGTKLAISGGGRCNVTNRLSQDEIIKHIPGNGKFMYSPFSVFNNEDIIAFFENLGVALKEEDHGRMFPVSNSAKDVVNALIGELHRLHVEVRMKTPVEAVHYDDEFHTVILQDGTHLQTKTIIIAVGGKAVPHTGSTGDGYAWAKKAGHTITDLFPTEVALTSNEPFIRNKSLQGLSLRDVALSVLNKKGKPIITHQMDMIFTHFGISGPAVLRCSQFAVKEFLKGRTPVVMHLDSLPSENEHQLVQRLAKEAKENPKKAWKNLLKGIVPDRLLSFALDKLDVDENRKSGEVSNETIRSLVHFLKNFTFQVNGSLPMEKAFVTGGGVSIKEIVPNTMQSKLMHGLFFCGEILDIHGYTGGYNITCALVTGRIAGMNAAEAANLTASH